MTFDPRSRARAMALEACKIVDTRYTTPLAIPSAIESALIAFAREVLTQEPDHMMLNLGYLERYKGPEQVWKVMSAHRAESLEDGA